MRKLDVLNNSQSLIPTRHARISRSQYGGTGIQRADDPGFSDGEGLLFHDLVKDGASAVGHFVKLINTADTIVTQN